MANLYDLKKFDLNLLVIFECIYQHLREGANKSLI